MTPFYVRIGSVVAVLTLLLAACSLKPTSQAMTPVATESIASTFYHWVYLPADSLKQETQENIAKRLFGIYLEQFKQESVDDQIRLKDYKVNNATLSAPFQYCVKDLGIESIVDIDFSVQTVDWPNPNWDAGNGGIDTPDHWIPNKNFTIAIFEYGNDYSFKVMGAPPCAGVAIDGSKVP
jgi:hypothetical protein